MQPDTVRPSQAGSNAEGGNRKALRKQSGGGRQTAAAGKAETRSHGKPVPNETGQTRKRRIEEQRTRYHGMTVQPMPGKLHQTGRQAQRNSTTGRTEAHTMENKGMMILATVTESGELIPAIWIPDAELERLEKGGAEK